MAPLSWRPIFGFAITSKESKEIDRFGRREFGDDRIGQVFSYVDRVSTGCARDRVRPKGGRRWSAIAHYSDIFFSNF